MYREDFVNEAEFSAFRTWALNGSTIGQRMGVGEDFEVPFYWEDWRFLVLEMQEEFPKTKVEFYAFLDKVRARIDKREAENGDADRTSNDSDSTS